MGTSSGAGRRAARSSDALSAIIDLLAEALAARIDFPPRPSSAASTSAAPAPFATRHKGKERSPALVARLADELLDALATRLDFPPRPSSVASALPARAGAMHRRQRRSPALVARLTDQLCAFIRKHPGTGIGKIATALGQSTADLALPTKKLLAAGKIKVKRLDRTNRYYPARSPALSDVRRDSR